MLLAAIVGAVSTIVDLSLLLILRRVYHDYN